MWQGYVVGPHPDRGFPFGDVPGLDDDRVTQVRGLGLGGADIRTESTVVSVVNSNSDRSAVILSPPSRGREVDLLRKVNVPSGPNPTSPYSAPATSLMTVQESTLTMSGGG